MDILNTIMNCTRAECAINAISVLSLISGVDKAQNHALLAEVTIFSVQT